MKENIVIDADITVEINKPETTYSQTIPLVENTINAGFPSPANDYIGIGIDLDRELIKSPASTFYGKVRGDSMQDINIADGDIIVIDKSLLPCNGDIAVCFLNGEFTLKTIAIYKDCLYLVSANKQYEHIKLTSDNNFIVWGIVTYVISKVKK